MSVVGGRLEDRMGEIELGDDPTRRQIKHLHDGVFDSRLFDTFGAVADGRHLLAAGIGGTPG